MRPVAPTAEAGNGRAALGRYRRSAGRDAGRYLVVGLPGKVLDKETAQVLRRVRPGGVILLPKNIEDEGQLRELIAAVRRLLPEALWCLDAEGGRVDRLRRVVAPAPGGTVLAGEPPAFARRSGRWVGSALAAFGFDVDFAPVVDLDYGRVNNALDGRCLGTSSRAVESRARAFLSGLGEAGVGGCLKHFPGLGRAGEDTHHQGTVIAADLEVLATDLAPYLRLGAEAGAVMINHASYPALEASGRPASLSPEIGTGLLRRRLRFRGVAFSDDLDMHALSPWGSPADRAEQSFAAGCDVVCLCHSLESAVEAGKRLGTRALAARREEAERRLARYRHHLAKLKKQARASSLPAIRRGLASLLRDKI